MAFFNPFRPSYAEDPYPSLERLREDDPVFYSRDLDGWVLTRHADCARVLREAEVFSSDPAKARGGLGAHVAHSRAASPLRDTPLVGSSDPPVHTRLRSIINRAFTPRIVEAERAYVREVAEGLFDAPSSADTLEFMSMVAEPLPVIVISDLLGLDEADRNPVRQRAQAVMRVQAGGELPPAAFREAEAAASNLLDFLARYAEEHRDDADKRLISILLEAEQQGDRLSHEELLAFVIFLYTAGSGPTAMMMANALLALSKHPDALAAVRADRSLVRPVLEESLRWDSATHVLLRFVTREVEVGGRTLRPGDTVFAMVAAAHRDPEVFPDPDRFDITRETPGGRLLSFGIGPHFCLGQPLAFIEGEEVLNAVLDRFEAIEIPRGGVERGDTFLLRGPRRLHLARA